MSREAELYKDKIEVSLDGRQIFYLFFGGAVIVGLVFVLGVMVGRRVEARGHTDRARVAATVDPLAALDRLEGGNGLSFQGALRGADGPVSDVEKTIAAMPKQQKGLGPRASDLEQRTEDKKVDAKVEDKKVDAKIEDKKADEKKADDKKADAKVEDKKADVKVEDKKTDKKVEAKVEDKKADVKVEAKSDAKPATKTETKADAKAETKTETKAETKDGEKKSKFTLQLSSFQDKGEAQAYLDSIKAAGYQAYVTEGAVDGKQYYRVRMGSYRSFEAASDAKAEFEKTAKKIAIVTKL
jgi:DedD protein